MRIAVLVKQVPRFEAMSLGPDGRLQREGLELEMNPYCRRAVAKGVELAAADEGSSCTVFTLGPPAAEDVLREAIAWGADEGVLVTDPAFAGSDALATARALAGALRREGPFDLVLVGRNSVDADTGQVGPEVAELLDLPFLAGVRELSIDRDGGVQARCEYDDGFVVASTRLPALLSCAERLCDPCKVPPDERALVDPSRIRTLAAPDIGEGPWGQAGSPTWVGRVEVLSVERSRRRLEGTVEEQVAEAVRELRDRGALGHVGHAADEVPVELVPPSRPTSGPVVAVVVEADRSRTARELLGAAATVAAAVDGHVVAIAFDATPADELAGAGADAIVRATGGGAVEEDAAAALATWCDDVQPWAVLAPGTMWGREVTSRVAARLGAGLTGDAVDVAVEDDRLVGWKPAFGGALVAAVTATSVVQMATVRPGMLSPLAPRAVTSTVPESTLVVEERGRVRHVEASRDDELDVLALAEVVVGVGGAVQPDEYPLLDPLLQTLGAELGATRKVTDKGWLPRARQIGITGRSIGPRLYVAVGLAGKFNHMVGVRGAGCVLAVNRDPDALVFDAADIGIVGDWHEVVPALANAIARSHPGAPVPSA